MCFSCWHVYRWCFCLNAHPASIESSEAIPKHGNPNTKEPASLQAASPDIRRTEIHRLRSSRASFHGHEKLRAAPPNGTVADQAGNKPVPLFLPESVRAHHTALAFSLLVQAVKRNDVLTSLSVSRSEQRAEQAQTETQTKKIPHTRLPISLRTLPPLAARDVVWYVCPFNGEDGRRPSLSISGKLGAVRTWELA